MIARSETASYGRSIRWNHHQHNPIGLGKALINELLLFRSHGCEASCRAGLPAFAHSCVPWYSLSTDGWWFIASFSIIDPPVDLSRP